MQVDTAQPEVIPERQEERCSMSPDSRTRRPPHSCPLSSFPRPCCLRRPPDLSPCSTVCRPSNRFPPSPSCPRNRVWLSIRRMRRPSTKRREPWRNRRRVQAEASTNRTSRSRWWREVAGCSIAGRTPDPRSVEMTGHARVGARPHRRVFVSADLHYVRAPRVEITSAGRIFRRRYLATEHIKTVFDRFFFGNGRDKALCIRMKGFCTDRPSGSPRLSSPDTSPRLCR